MNEELSESNPFFVVQERRRPRKMVFTDYGVVTIFALQDGGWVKLASYNRYAKMDYELALGA